MDRQWQTMADYGRLHTNKPWRGAAAEMGVELQTWYYTDGVETRPLILSLLSAHPVPPSLPHRWAKRWANAGHSLAGLGSSTPSSPPAPPPITPFPSDVLAIAPPTAHPLTPSATRPAASDPPRRGRPSCSVETSASCIDRAPTTTTLVGDPTVQRLDRVITERCEEASCYRWEGT